MPQGKGSNAALLLRVNTVAAEVAEKDYRKDVHSAWSTSRAAFEDLDPFHGNETAPLKTRSIFGDTAGGILGGTVQAMLLNLGGDRAVTRPYLQNPWVFACVQANARSVASLPVRLVSGDTEEGGQPLQDKKHPLVRLFAKPNPLQSQAKFFKQLVNYHLLWGETFLLLLKREHVPAMEGKPAMVRLRPVNAVDESEGTGMMAKVETPDEMWPVAGHLVEDIIDEEKHGPLPYMYRIRTSTGTTEYPAHAVVQLADANPHSVLRGVGPLTAAMRDVAKGYQIDRFDDALMKNGGSPGGVLSLEGSIQDEELATIRNAWREAQDAPDRHRQTAVLPRGVKYESHGFTPQEMEFKDMREWIRQTIMALFGVTKPILGITDDVNMANSREAYRVFWETTVIPLVRFFEDEINFKLVGHLAEYSEKVTFTMDLDGVEALREDMDSKVDRTLKLYKDGHRSFSEAAGLSGWDLGEQQLEGADERWVPSNLLLAEYAAEPPLPPPTMGADGEDTQEDDAGGNGADESADESEEEDAGGNGADESEDEDATAKKAARARAMQSTELDMYWRRHDTFLRGHEARFARTTFGVFRGYLAEVNRRLVEIAKSAENKRSNPRFRFVVSESELERLLDINIGKWNEAMFAKLSPEFVAVMTSAAKQLHAEVSGGATVLQGTDPEVLDFLRFKKVRIVEGYTSKLAETLQRKLVAVLATAPANHATLAHAIMDVLEGMQAEVQYMQGFAGRRAMMIARTEVGSSTSYARTEQMRRDGVKRHMWLTSRDSHVRDTHEALEGVERSVGEAWGNGLLYPLDPNGPASEIINCRCTTKPLIEDPPEPPPIPRLSSAPTVDLLVCMDDEEPNTLLLLGGEVLRQVRPGESVNGRTYDELKAACILQGPFMLALTPEQANANPNE